MGEQIKIEDFIGSINKSLGISIPELNMDNFAEYIYEVELGEEGIGEEYQYITSTEIFDAGNYNDQLHVFKRLFDSKVFSLLMKNGTIGEPFLNEVIRGEDNGHLFIR